MIRVIKFETRYRVGKDPVDWVLVAPMGEDFEKTQTWHRVAKIRPSETADPNIRDSESYKDMEAKWTIIGPRYEAWKHGNEIPDEGTPLGAWSGVTAEQAAALRALDIRTVEEVRDLPDGVKQQLRLPNIPALQLMAREFLEGRTAAEKDAELAEMREKMAAMEELLAERMAADAPKKPGRPKKSEAA